MKITTENRALIALGIETSCDETSVALINSNKEILAHHVASQIKDHEIYGGVVPEIAARAHLSILPGLLDQIFKDALLHPRDVDVIAATTGPGLIGGVVVGTMAAKAMAAALRKPFVAVNHLEGHALTARLTETIEFPFVLLLVSGGHCQTMLVENVGTYKVLGATLDDAVGECFDKVAKMLGLPYPGGPQIETLAIAGDPKAFDFPRPMIGQKHLNFSFSGLKTAVRQTIQKLQAEHGNTLPESIVADVCASFQQTVARVLYDRVKQAFLYTAEHYPNYKQFVVAGGVAANQHIRGALQAVCAEFGFAFFAPPLSLCTDNGAMIAWAGLERFQQGLIDSLNIKPRPRWPMDQIRGVAL
ncbi:MAG: tRNA (adenosine(37)-N6)-threonylcarbamoyltransferase complex transferase subunit TsaD [Alphaproteobacteria bacterium]|nr:tRNA (adenosine(37)-N6)-threonylcarbamoyltransferase complex transferase subunit TsaD [Alphaproteobacteria bacterium]